MAQKKNAPTSKTSESAADKRNSNHHFSPPQTRALAALQRGHWVAREQIDRIAGASNGPAVIAAIREKLGTDAVEMRRVDATDRDGRPCKPGRYRLTEQGRARLAEMGGL